MSDLAKQLTGWKKKYQDFSDSLPSLGMRTPEEEAERQKRLKQAQTAEGRTPPLPTTPKRWEKPNMAGETEEQRKKRIGY